MEKPLGTFHSDTLLALQGVLWFGDLNGLWANQSEGSGMFMVYTCVSNLRKLWVAAQSRMAGQNGQNTDN